MTTPCAQNHPPILHDEFHCPLCGALEDLGAAEDQVADKEDHIRELEGILEQNDWPKIDALQKRITSLQDDLWRTRKALEGVTYRLRTAFNRRPLKGGMKAHLKQIEEVLWEAESKVREVRA